MDPELIQALKVCAAENGVSAEAEHRAILKTALFRVKRRPFNDGLASIPDVGLDSDFQCRQD